MKLSAEYSSGDHVETEEVQFQTPQYTGMHNMILYAQTNLQVVCIHVHCTIGYSQALLYTYRPVGCVAR